MTSSANFVGPKGGTLRTTPLYELLIAALESELTGSLVFESHGGHKTALTLSDGKLVKIKPAQPVHLLGEVCVELGMITQAQLDGVLAQVKRKLMGTALLNSGLLTEAQLDDALAAQMMRQVRWTANLPRGSVFGLYPDKDFLAKWGELRSVDPLAVIWSAVAGARLEPVAVQAVLEPLGAVKLKLHPKSQVARFGFSPKQRSLIDVLRVKPMLVSELVRCGIVPEAEAQRVVMVLGVTRHIDLGPDAIPLGVQPVQETALDRDVLERAVARNLKGGVAGAAGSPGTRRSEIIELSTAIDNMDYYEMLGLPRGAPQSTIQAEFFRKAKRWHPDKLEPESADLKDKVTHVFSRMTEAHQTLTNPAQRKDYDKRLEAGGEDEKAREEVQRALNAASLFQKAEVCVKRGEWDKALEFASRAAADDPEQAEYDAMAAWLLAREVQNGDRSAYVSMLERLMAAAKRQPDNPRIRLFRARVFRLAGMANEAMRDFKAVAEVDPSNVEAKRELHLHKGKTPEPGAVNVGILGRLFKKG